MKLARLNPSDRYLSPPSLVSFSRATFDPEFSSGRGGGINFKQYDVIAVTGLNSSWKALAEAVPVGEEEERGEEGRGAG